MTTWPSTNDGLANIKERINRGDTVRAVTLPVTTGKDGIAAAVEAGGYDFVNTDAQHAACDEERLQAFCAAATDIGVPVKLRIKHTDHAYLIGNYLDLGPSGIEIPEVMEESTVDEALRRFYYPPVGPAELGRRYTRGLVPRRHAPRVRRLVERLRLALPADRVG